MAPPRQSDPALLKTGRRRLKKPRCGLDFAAETMENEGIWAAG